MKRNKIAGYLCIVGGALSTFVNRGIFRSTTLIYEMLLEQFGASKAITGWVFGTFELIVWAFAWVSTYLCKRYGCRIVAISGGIIKAVGILLCAFPSSLGFMFFSYGALSAIGTSMTWNPVYIIISQHYNKQKARATSISTMGGPIGGIVLAPLIQSMFEKYGYNGTMLILSAITLHLCVGGALFSPPKPLNEIDSIEICDIRINEDKKMAPKQDGSTVIRQKQYDEDISNDSKTCIPESRFLTTNDLTNENTQKDTKSQVVNKSFSLTIKEELREVTDILRNPLFFSFSVCMMLIFFSFSATVTFMAGLGKQKQITKMQSALILSIASGADIICRPIFGIVYDLKVFREKRSLLFIAISLLFAFSIGLLPLTNGFIWFLIHWSLSMLLITGFLSQYLTVMGDLVGTENLPHAMGFNGLLNGLGATLGPVLGGLLHDKTGTYDMVYYLSAGLCTIGILIFLTAEAVHLCLRKQKSPE